MNHFPVISSVLSPTALETLIREQYHLKDARCAVLKTFVNDSYSVANGSDQYIFRVYTKGWRSELEIHEELRMIRYIQNAGISVSHPITDVLGNDVQKLFAPEGDRYGVLFSFAKGEKKFNASIAHQRKLGEYLAKVHQATLGLKMHRPDYDAVTMVLYSFEKFNSFLVTGSPEETFILETKKRLLEEFKQIDPSALRRGGVHLDFWGDNLHIDVDENITLFDFDFCGNGFLVLDVAFYLQSLQTMEPDEKVISEKTSAFLEGYESITPLTAEEKRIIPLLGACLCFYYLGEQKERFATVFFNAEHLKRFINFRLKRWMKFHNMIK